MSKSKVAAVIGGGPAGAMTAEKLARGGCRVVVFEERLGWEKPCGGGLTPKALRRYPFLAKVPGNGRCIRDVEFLAANQASMRFRLRQPLAIYSRAALNQFLLRRAQDAGAEIVEDRIVHLRAQSSGWELEGRKGPYRADFIVLAAGARTRLRRLFTVDFRRRDLMLTFGYFVPGRETLLRVQFYENFEGYAWSFPRWDHLSVGICGKVGQDSMAGLQERLHEFMKRFSYSRERASAYSHLLPSLAADAWGSLPLAGQSWALAGDAAGLVDPVTGEGIFYALRSGELIGELLLEDQLVLYPQRIREEFGDALALVARLAYMFYHEDFLGKPITTRMVELAARSRKFQGLVRDLVEGAQSYAGLVLRLYYELSRTPFEVAADSIRQAVSKHPWESVVQGL
jgi:geranylgeranyl diphosphate/geranylgeranyl-bacteriochlorophyllide a reductase